MDNSRVLISGAGIAGTTLAFWLKRFGFNPTVVEIAPKLRGGGYVIDFWGAGFEIAERMGIVDEVSNADVGITELSFVDEKNKRKGGMDYVKLKKLMNGRAVTLLRSDLARIIYDRLPSDVEIIFGDSISRIEQHEDDIMVTFESGTTRTFDLVVGADGLHSKVRKLIFGNETQFEKYYGYYTASFTFENMGHHEKAFLSYNVPGKQAAVYSINEHKSATFFIFTAREKLAYAHHDVEAQKQILRNEFEGIGWKCPEILSRMDAAPDFYFDVVSQIQMQNWSNQHATLVGDACDCPSLLSGQGSTLAMTGAYILAGELKKANGDYKSAFAQYEKIFRPFIEGKQKIAQTFASSLVPQSSFGIWMRNTFANLMFLPFLSKLFIKQFMSDKLELKNY